MKLAPVANMVAAPARLPVFDDAWKARCRACRNFEAGEIGVTGASMLCRAVGSNNHKAALASCGDARLFEGKCGPGAALWQARDAQ